MPHGVAWVEGTASVLPTAAFDVAVMTSHVAQLLVTDDEWTRTFADLRRALVPGGRLIFDTRDPLDRRWERWNPRDSARHPVLADGTVVQAWTEVTEVADDVVSFTHHYVFPDGVELTSTAALRFRGEGRGAIVARRCRVRHRRRLRRVAPRSRRPPRR